MHTKIATFLESQLALSLNVNKTIIDATPKGIDFVRYIVRNKYVLVRNSTVKRMERNFLALYKQLTRTSFNLGQLKKINASVSSYKSVLFHANSWKLHQKLLATQSQNN